ncbi:MAG: dihydrolipoyl dehydrogenase [Lachnospiraceae bacterium]|nr:dihydrolipoyl dehydrogenase [Lachnospiraceae bacterium]
MENYDLLVIGGGPGGYSVAIAAGKKGLKTALFEKEKVGGTCLNVGCIPTKYLVDKANAMEKVRSLVNKNIFDGAGSFSFKKIISEKDEVVKKLTGGVSFLLKKAGVDVINGVATLKKNRTVECEGKSYRGKNVIIATGSVTASIPIPGAELCIDSTEALSLGFLPRSMTVIGGGIIGLELACAFAAYGTEITVVEMLPELMAKEQKEAARIVINSMKKLGITIRTGAKMLRVEKEGALRRAVFEYEGSEESVVCEQVLMAVGRKSNLCGIDPEKIGLEMAPRGVIKVDEYQRTNLPGVYAIGDAAGGYQLAHAAYAEGETALAHICGEDRPYGTVPVPVCTYTIPCLASVGLNTETAAAAGYEPVLGSFDYSANGMALAEGAGGCVYVVADKNTGKTLGITIVGENSSEMIAMAASAVADELATDEWEKMIVAHPSLCEMVREAALDCFGRSVHK